VGSTHFSIVVELVKCHVYPLKCQCSYKNKTPVFNIERMQGDIKQILELCFWIWVCLSVPDPSCDQACRNAFWAVTQNALRHVSLTCGTDYACHWQTETPHSCFSSHDSHSSVSAVFLWV